MLAIEPSFPAVSAVACADRSAAQSSDTTTHKQALQLIERSVRERSVRERSVRERSVRNLTKYNHPDHKEARVRAEFIDPLLQALGWDGRSEIVAGG